MKPEMDPYSDPRVAAGIDCVLRAIGRASPEAGMEGRILTRLASERARTPARLSLLPRASRLRPYTTPALCVGSTLLLAVVIVAGSVSHSRRNAPAPGPVAPVLHLPDSGVGAASAAHPAGPSSAPIPVGKSARGRSLRHSAQGRARVAPHARKPRGVVVPNPSATPQN